MLTIAEQLKAHELDVETRLNLAEQLVNILSLPADSLIPLELLSG